MSSHLEHQDYLLEDEDICDVCRNVRKHAELKEVESVSGGTMRVCDGCVTDGWAEE